jgi:hypothetical protein
MSEHQKQTAFLRECLLHHESVECRELEEGIARILRDERCVRRAMGLMVVLLALALVGLGYAAAFLGDPVPSMRFPVVKLSGALGLGSLISLVGFAGLGAVYRKDLNGRREKCRRLAAKLIESRLGRASANPVPRGVNHTEAPTNSSEPAASPPESATLTHRRAEDQNCRQSI